MAEVVTQQIIKSEVLFTSSSQTQHYIIMRKGRCLTGLCGNTMDREVVLNPKRFCQRCIAAKLLHHPDSPVPFRQVGA